MRHLAAVPTHESDPAAWPLMLAAFAAELRVRRAAPAAASGKLAHIRRLARECGEESPGSVTTDRLVEFLARDGWSERTRKAHRASLVDFFTWAEHVGYLEHSPATALPRLADLPRSSSTITVPANMGNDPNLADAVTRSVEHPARSWARAASLPHAATGRLPREVVAAWIAAGSPITDAGQGSGKPWEVLIGGYTTELRARGCRPGTIHLRSLHLRRFAAYLDDEPSAVTRETLIEFLADPSWAPETRRNVRSTLATFYSWAHETGRLSSNPAARLPGVKVPQGVPSPAPETMIRDAINGARPDVRLMILLGALAGLRRAEIALLRAECVTDDGLRIEGKGGRVRLVPTHPSLADEIAAFQRHTGRAQGYLFTHPNGLPYTVAYVGVLISGRMPAGWSAHKLRHRFASRSYAGQYNIRAVQQLLGHSSPTVTARYVAVPETALIDAVRAVPPIPGIEAMTPRARSVRPDEFTGVNTQFHAQLPGARGPVAPGVHPGEPMDSPG